MSKGSPRAPSRHVPDLRKGKSLISDSSELGKPVTSETPSNPPARIQDSKSEIRNPIRVIFFDLGQTLVTAATQSPRRMLASRLALSEKETRKVGRLIMTHPATEPAVLALALKETLFHREQQTLQRVIEEVWEEQRRCVRAIDGAASVLTALKEKGFALGLLSNTWHPLHSGFLRNCPEMAELLDHSVLSYRLGSKKPSPEIFRHAMAEADAPAEQCWMIGDSYELDIEPAMTAGMHTIWVLRSPEKEQQVLAQVLRGEKPCPDWSVARLDEVLECFSGKGLL
jgi:HAD superfamily hydrolase (TIGR01509 family)